MHCLPTACRLPANAVTYCFAQSPDLRAYLCWADCLAKLASDAALLACWVAAQDVLTPETWADGSLLKGVVDLAKGTSKRQGKRVQIMTTATSVAYCGTDSVEDQTAQLPDMRAAKPTVTQSWMAVTTVNAPAWEPVSVLAGNIVE